MTGPADFAKLVPGFDFLQGLMKNAGQSIPGMGQWIAPTLDPEEIGKRIEQLRTVQFWLEQNARLLSTTIQALEVQRMTLSTLKNMNMPMDRMREAFTIPPSAAQPGPASAPAAAEAPAAPKAQRKPRAPRKPSAPADAAGSAPPVDPMQWWNALTQQFTELASSALKDGGGEVAKNLAGQALKAATELPARAMRAAAPAASPAKSRRRAR